MANLSIYSHLLKPHETLDLGGAIKDGMSMRQLSMQNTQAERTMDESEKKRKLMAAIPAMEHLSSMSPEERAAAYPRMQEQMIADGIMDRNQALPAHDEKSFQFKWAMMQKSPEYRAIQKDMLGNKLTESQIAKNYADAKKEKGNGLKEYFELGSGLRKEWTGLPTTKATQDVAASYNRVSGAAEDPSPAGDLALIFNYMKMLDPGSTVREGEFANAQNAGSAFQQVGSLYNQVMSGKRLTEGQRADFLDRANKMYGAQLKSQSTVDSQYEALAQRYGVDPSFVMMKFPNPKEITLAVRQEEEKPGFFSRLFGGKQANATPAPQKPDFKNMTVEELIKYNSGGQ